MRILNFANRNIKELLRDPLSIIFSILLPLFLLYIFQQFKIPSEVYEIQNFTPSIIIFSYGFLTLFVAGLVARDRNTSLLARLYSSPMKPFEYVIGYSLSLIPLIVIQNILFFAVALLLGLEFSISVILTIIVLIPVSLLFIGLGILVGSISTEKSATGIGSVAVQLVAFTSGMYFTTDMIGGFFSFLCKVLPFSYAVDLAQYMLNGKDIDLIKTIIVIGIYILVTCVLAGVIFKRKMISDNK